MTAQELQDLQRAVALRMSINTPNRNLSWKEWTELLRRRLAVMEIFTHEGERPTWTGATQLAADALTFLYMVQVAEDADPAAGEAA